MQTNLINLRFASTLMYICVYMHSPCVCLGIVLYQNVLHTRLHIRMYVLYILIYVRNLHMYVYALMCILHFHVYLTLLCNFVGTATSQSTGAGDDGQNGPDERRGAYIRTYV